MDIKELLTARIEFYQGQHGFEELILRSLQQEKARLRKNVALRNPSLGDSEIDEICDIKKVCNATFDWKVYATIRQLLFDDANSFCCAMQMASRICHIGLNLDDEIYTNVWGLLSALAVGDEKVIDRWQKVSPASIENGHAPTVRLYNLASSLVRGQADEQERLLKSQDLQKGERWIASLCSLIASVEAGDIASQHEQVCQHVKAYAKRAESSAENNILPMELLGVTRLLARSHDTRGIRNSLPNFMGDMLINLENWDISDFESAMAKVDRPHIFNCFVGLEDPHQAVS